MSYQVIARKWRPQTFDEVTGQEPITRTLRNAIEHDRLHHAYLFSGARGVGKTTTARLLAKALNCRRIEKPNVYPCRSDDAQQCVSCREIAESRSMDVLEIDAASHTGIDAVRDTIIEGININPARDRFRVFIIDEVHQLSKPAFNALLKTLEEPPPNVVFVMATTELHKVPDTILSRCQQFEFRTISQQKIFDRLKLIAEAEQIDAADGALREVARSGEGSMRDAQSNFDQVISFSGNRIEAADVAAALGTAGVDMLVRIVSAVADKNSAAVLGVVDELIARGHDLRNFARDLLSLFRDLLVLKVGGQPSLIENSILTADEMQRCAEPFSETDFLRFFNSLSDTEGKLRDAVQPRFALEIGLVKLVEMSRVRTVESLLERLTALEAKFEADQTSPSESRKAAAAEKKTLISEIEALESPGSHQDLLTNASTDGRIEPDAVESLVFTEHPDLSFLDALPVKLPPMSDEELEHIEDSWLDAAYEAKLARTGDDLLPIISASLLVDAVSPAASANGARPGASDRSAAEAIAAQFINRVPQPEEIDNEIPELPVEATDDQLREFANHHPAVRRALKIFRGKIVDVRRI